MNRPQFALGLMMIAIAVAGVVLAIVVGDPGSVIPALYVASIFIPCLYALSKIPSLPLRLTFAILAACFLLAVSAGLWQPPFYTSQLERTERLAELCSRIADRSGDDGAKARFRRKAAWYRRQAFHLKLQAMWHGLIRSFTKEDPVAMTAQDWIREFGTLEAIERYKRIAEPMKKETSPRTPPDSGPPRADSGPERDRTYQPGQSPGARSPTPSKALKGRHKLLRPEPPNRSASWGKRRSADGAASSRKNCGPASFVRAGSVRRLFDPLSPLRGSIESAERLNGAPRILARRASE